MATMTTDQIADIRADLGIETTLTNADLDRLYTRANGDYNLTVVYALRQLLSRAHKLVVYTVGIDSLNKDKVFQNLKDLLEVWSKIAGAPDKGLVATTGYMWRPDSEQTEPPTFDASIDE